MIRGDGELGTSGRFAAAASASVISAIVVNPFDVVKTRLQAQSAQLASPVRWAQAGVESCPPACATTRPSLHAADCENFSSTVDGIQKIVRREGFRALWRGLDASLMMAVPAVGIYMPLYDSLMKPLEGLGASAPLAAGALARMTAVLITSPLELVRTRTQAVFRPQDLASAAPPGSATARTWSSVYLAAADLSALGRVQMLWRGVGATLARDVPFSAVYWGMLEPIRQSLLPSDGSMVTPMRTITVNMLAGGLGGAAASAFTQPLDVVKTRMQLSEGAKGPRGGTLGTLRRVASQEGVRSLFAGVTPRALKAAPACAIVLASYECMKLVVYRPAVE